MDLRILLVEKDEQRAGHLQACLGSASHSIVPVPNLEEATEALFIQKFEVVLIGSGQPAGELSSFLTKLRTLEAQQPMGSQLVVLSCASELAGLPSIDGTLPEVFDAAQLYEVLSAISTDPAGPARDGAPAFDVLPVFEPERFEEQCANEAELMIEIIDLFAEECTREVPEMTEALESENFERLSRLAHTIKGSLGSLHTPVAWRHAQDLEAAAKAQNRALCAVKLDALEHSLKEVNEHLKRFREACMAR